MFNLEVFHPWFFFPYLGKLNTTQIYLFYFPWANNWRQSHDIIVEWRCQYGGVFIICFSIFHIHSQCTRRRDKKSSLFLCFIMYTYENERMKNLPWELRHMSFMYYVQLWYFISYVCMQVSLAHPDTSFYSSERDQKNMFIMKYWKILLSHSLAVGFLHKSILHVDIKLLKLLQSTQQSSYLSLASHSRKN